VFKQTNLLYRDEFCWIIKAGGTQNNFSVQLFGQLMTSSQLGRMRAIISENKHTWLKSETCQISRTSDLVAHPAMNTKMRLPILLKSLVTRLRTESLHETYTIRIQKNKRNQTGTN